MGWLMVTCSTQPQKQVEKFTRCKKHSLQKRGPNGINPCKEVKTLCSQLYLLPWLTGDAVELAAALARQPQAGAGTVRPPAIVVEYMGQGSLKGALARKADIVQGALIRVLIAMDAAKVS